MKYFVISDIHGYYDAMIESLKKAGHDLENNNHQLLILGDMFDRGPQSKEVLKYLYSLYQNGKAQFVLGNHDLFLIEFLQGDYRRSIFNIQHNGFGKTLKSLSQMTPVVDNLEEIHTYILQQYPYLLDWLTGFNNFIEIDNYVFVHGGIDSHKGDWRNLKQFDYVWTREIDCDPIPDKVVVAGHHRVPTIRYPNKDYYSLYKTNPQAYDILYKPGKILIDRFVEVSQELNVLVIEM
ncbi:MAG: fructose-bisphosphatase class III [Candidatus Izimaplasma sp.]|nr:fructose-bisphosphatase class III [Candidatus Izimaplasma bacterium]